MNKIKIYTSPLLLEELNIFEKFYDKENFYILRRELCYSEPIDIMFTESQSFCLYGSTTNKIFKTNEQQRYFWRLMKKIGERNEFSTDVDYSIYEKYL